jgi:hypothetical protein
MLLRCQRGSVAATNVIMLRRMMVNWGCCYQWQSGHLANMARLANMLQTWHGSKRVVVSMTYPCANPPTLACQGACGSKTGADLEASWPIWPKPTKRPNWLASYTPGTTVTTALLAHPLYVQFISVFRPRCVWEQALVDRHIRWSNTQYYAPCIASFA